MNSNILFALMIFTFFAILAFAFLDLQNTRRAIKRDEKSAAAHPDLGPQGEGYALTTPG